MFSKSVGSVGRGRGCGCSGGGVAAHQPLTGQPWLHAHCRMMRDAALYGKGFTTTGGCRRYGNEPLDGKRPAPATQMFSQPGRVCPAPPADADLIFTAVKPKGAKRIGFEAFETALEKVRGEGGWWVPGGGCRRVLVPAHLPSQHARSRCPLLALTSTAMLCPCCACPPTIHPPPGGGQEARERGGGGGQRGGPRRPQVLGHRRRVVPLLRRQGVWVGDAALYPTAVGLVGCTAFACLHPLALCWSCTQRVRPVEGMPSNRAPTSLLHSQSTWGGQQGRRPEGTSVHTCRTVHSLRHMACMPTHWQAQPTQSLLF